MEFNSTLEKLLVDAAFDGAALHIRASAGASEIELWLEGGCIVAAKSDGDDARLGARLTATGHLREADLKVGQRSAASQGVPLAQTLSGKVRRDVISEIAAEEARFAVAAALAQTHGSVNADQSSPPGPPLISLDLSSLLVESKALMVDIQAAQVAAPAGARPTVAKQPGPGDGLTAQEWAVFDRCDGNSTVGAIASVCGLSNASASLIVSKLSSSGFVIVRDIDAPEFLIDQDLEALSAQFANMADDALRAQQMPAEPSAGTAFIQASEPVTQRKAAPSDNVRPAEKIADISPRVDTQALLRELASLSRETGKS